MESTTWMNRVVKAGQKQILPPRVFVYGPPGIGKSTFAASMPNALIIDFDHGADEVRADQIPGPATWEESMGLIREIVKSPGSYQTIAIDTVDPLEEMCQAYVVKRAGTSWEKLNDDYGSGYNLVGGEWKIFLAELDEARKRGLHVALLAHAVVRSAKDPQLGDYDQFTVQLGKKPWSLTQRWSDLVAFAAFDAERDKKEDRAIVTKDRLLYVVRGSGYEAKNRFGLPQKLPLSWEKLSGAIAANRATGEELTERILKLADGNVEFTEKAKTFIAQCEGDPIKLRALEQALLKKLAEPAPSAPAQVTPPVVTTTQAAPPPPPAQVTPPVSSPVTPPAVPPQDAEAIRERIVKLAKGTSLETQAAKYLEQVGGDVAALSKLEATLKLKLAPPAPNPNGSVSPS